MWHWAGRPGQGREALARRSRKLPAMAAARPKVDTDTGTDTQADDSPGSSR